MDDQDLMVDDEALSAVLHTNSLVVIIGMQEKTYDTSLRGPIADSWRHFGL